MKKIGFLTFLVPCLFLLCFSCGKDDPPPVLNNPDPGGGQIGNDTISIVVEGIRLFNKGLKDLGPTHAIVAGSIPSLAPTFSPIYQHGHYLYDFVPINDTTSINSHIDSIALGAVTDPLEEYTSEFRNLKPNTTYYYLAYVWTKTSDVDKRALSATEQGELFINSFTTTNNSTPPLVSTTQAQYLTPNNFKLQGKIDFTNDVPLSRWGFVWSEGKDTEPTLTKNEGISTIGTNQVLEQGHIFNSNVNLQSRKSYTIRAYAENPFGIAYGESLYMFGDYNWNDYNDPPGFIFAEVHSEDFKNNDRGWNTDGHATRDIDYFLSTSSGYFSINNKEEDGTSYVTEDIDLIGLTNYQIDLDVRVSYGDYVSGIRWERKDWDGDGFVFGYDEDENYSVGYWDINEQWNTLNGKESDLLESNDYNKLSIRKLGGRFYLFINKSFVYSFIDDRFDGTHINFRVGGKGRAYYKNFEVKSFGN